MSKRPRRNHSPLFQGQGGRGRLQGREDAGRVVPIARRARQQIVDWKNQLLERASSVFGAQAAAPTVDLKDLHAKIGQLALKKIFWPARPMGHQAHSAEWARPAC